MAVDTRRRSRFISEAMKFSAVGGISYLVDIGIFNLLRISGLEVVSMPLVAKTFGIAIATLVAWLGSRYWTFRSSLRADPGREFVEFVLVAAAGYGINILVLYISHYVFGFHSLLADNISGNLVGAALATIFRFGLYRGWIYHPRRSANR